MLMFLSCLLLSVSHAQKLVNLPVEVIDAVRAQYPPSVFEMKPQREDVLLTIKGGKNLHSLRVGVGQEVVDLSNYVDARHPEFQVTFQAPFPIDGANLFFINRYKAAPGQGGLPCGKAVRVRERLDELFSTQGIKLMTKDGRYLNLLGGDFLLTHFDGQKFRMVYFKIVDGRYVARLCKLGV